MKNFQGEILFLNRSDINTDEIIPAKYLTEISKEALKPYLLEDLKLTNFNHLKDLKNKSAIVTRSNFGCGSSREHAPWALEVNGINLVIAESFARIFRQNMFNCGLLAIELSLETIDKIFNFQDNQKVEVETDLDKEILTISKKEATLDINFKISEFDKDLIKAGGWVNYAEQKY